MKLLPTSHPEVLLIEPRVFGDARGGLVELWREEHFAEKGLLGPFVQDNLSFSSRGVLRGLHFQHPRGQGKLVTVLQGSVVDVVVDIRADSAHFGRWTMVTLDDVNRHALLVPAGFAHGFAVTSEVASVLYKFTDSYQPQHEAGIAWNDPELAIPWPAGPWTVSERDARHPRLAEVARERLPRVADQKV